MKLAAAAGVLAFFAVTGGAVLDPGNTAWLLRHPDTATSYLGWQFFRQAPLLQLPLGANPLYGMEIGTSVVFSDSIPLLALAFKPLAALLPQTFQYFGLWLLACFVLQAVFAFGLLRRFSNDTGFALIGTGFFLLAPACLFRLGGHLALFGQWAVLAALGLYFASRFAPRAWLALLAAAALIHFYLLAMAAALALADLWQRRWRDELTPLQAGRHVATAAAVTLGLMWLAGYFMIGNAAVAMPGFGMFRMNLLSPVDPDGLWSRLLPDQPGAENDFEGFNYLGLGILLLAPFAAYALFAQRGSRPTIVPLAVMSLVLTLLALSNRVGFGAAELVRYELPELLQPAADLLRGSGRLFWPVYYLVYVAVLAAVWRTLPRRAALGACALMLALQTVDSVPGLRRVGERLAREPAWTSPMKSPLWAELGARYKRVVHVLPANDHEAFVPWAAFAAQHGMAVNFGYFARVNAERLTAARNDTEAAVLGNRLQADSLYAFGSEPLWNLAAAQARGADVAGALDGFRIIAPRLRECAACNLRALADVRAEPVAGYSLGERVAFGRGAGRRRHATLGWSLPEDWGMRSQSASATVVLRLVQQPRGELVLDIEARAFAAGQEVDLSVNGVALPALAYAVPRATESRRVAIPHAALAGGKGFVMITFKSSSAVGLVSLRLSEAGDSPERSAGIPRRLQARTR